MGLWLAMVDPGRVLQGNEELDMDKSIEGTTGTQVRVFQLVREEDVSGISGVGTVADGVVFPDGVAVLRWLRAGGSTAIYDSVEDVERIHGHDGKTRLVWCK